MRDIQLHDYEREHLRTLRSLAPECTVLLKRSGDFPLAAPCRIALYGNGARKTIKGGTGSGDVNSRFYVTAEQGLEDAGFTVVTRAWMDAYDKVHAQSRRRFVEEIRRRAKELRVHAALLGMGAVMPEPEHTLPLEGDTETAVYVLSRVCGEGSDRRAVKGDLLLTDAEIRDILACRARYRKFLLVLNVGAMVDLTPVSEVENILLLSQLGAVTGDVLADLLLGRSCPSGKLTATWCGAAELPSVGDFGAQDDTRYREGVYVGYRYFDSVGAAPLFPFGHGLSYTDFSVRCTGVSLEGSEVSVTAEAENRGALPGRETLQLYVSAPSGRLDQPFQRLAAFRKSGEIAAGETQRLTLGFDLADAASYDAARGAYVLEPGSYVLRLGKSSRDTSPCAVIELSEEVTVRDGLAHVGGEADFVDWRPEVPRRAEDLSGVPHLTVSAGDFRPQERPEPAVPSRGSLDFARTLSDAQLAALCVGAHGKLPGVLSLIGSASQKVAGAAGESFGGIPGLRALVMADGPAGLRLSRDYYRDAGGARPVGGSFPADLAEFLPPLLVRFLRRGRKGGEVCHQHCTAMPIGTAVAQSWDPALAERCGEIVGEEMERFGVDLWLAPAFNIQRDPLCGRNFEYFSEDPLLSGKIAAAMTRGVQRSPGRGVTVKHFCCNNQETNRFQSNSVVGERALREIYLRPFEICLREADPAALMTSYNLLNGVHTSERPYLLQTLLREEWGWGGLIMTDWIVSGIRSGKAMHPVASAAASVRAGNGLIMPGSGANEKEILAALRGKNSAVQLSRAEAERCVAFLADAVRRLEK